MPEDPVTFVLELEKTVGKQLTESNLKLYQNKFDLINDAWRIESIESLLEMFHVYDSSDDTELKTIIYKITNG